MKCYGYWVLMKDIKDGKTYVDKKSMKIIYNPKDPEKNPNLVTGKEGIKHWCKLKSEPMVRNIIYTLDTYSLILNEINRSEPKQIQTDKVITDSRSRILPSHEKERIDLCELSELVPMDVLMPISMTRNVWYDNKIGKQINKPNEVIQKDAIKELIPKIIKGEKINKDEVKLAKVTAQQIKPTYELKMKLYPENSFVDLEDAKRYARDKDGYVDDPPKISKQYWVIYEKVKKWT
uniref:Uncharacterized protein n=1 Tax=viral metagenome TaxID=1070528 RepID=A0A6H2A011_9ZZZZ